MTSVTGFLCKRIFQLLRPARIAGEQDPAQRGQHPVQVEGRLRPRLSLRRPHQPLGPHLGLREGLRPLQRGSPQLRVNKQPMITIVDPAPMAEVILP